MYTLDWGKWKLFTKIIYDLASVYTKSYVLLTGKDLWTVGLSLQIIVGTLEYYIAWIFQSVTLSLHVNCTITIAAPEYVHHSIQQILLASIHTRDGLTLPKFYAHVIFFFPCQVSYTLATKTSTNTYILLPMLTYKCIVRHRKTALTAWKIYKNSLCSIV